MKNISMLAVIAFSVNAFSFENMVQDYDAGETQLAASFETRNSDITISNGSNSSTLTSDVDTTSVLLGHHFEVSSDILIGAAIQSEKRSSEGESETDTTAGLKLLSRAYDEAVAITASYTSRENDQDQIGVSIEKELAFESNSNVDGAFAVGFGLNENTDEVEGGNSFYAGIHLRATLAPSLQVESIVALTTTSDYEYIEDGLTVSSDPSIGYGVGISYAIIPNLYFDLSYVGNSSDGTITNNFGSADISTDTSAFIGSIHTVF